jgi:DNA polymerase-3 subunit alpha
VNKRVLECLIKSGAFDYSGDDRGALLEDIDGILNEMVALQRDRERGQESFFDVLDSATEASEGSNGRNGHNGNGRLRTNTVMPLFEKLKFEKELLGFYVSGHPMNGYKDLDIAIDTIKDNNLLTLEDRSYFRLCGVVSNISKKISRRDKRPWAILSLGTRHSTYSINIYADAFSKYSDLLINGELLMVTGLVLNPLDPSIPDVIKKICWVVRPDAQADDFLDKLRNILDDNYGDTQNEIGFLVDDNHLVITNIAASLTWKVRPDDFLKLRQHPAIASVEIQTNMPYSNVNHPW